MWEDSGGIRSQIIYKASNGNAVEREPWKGQRVFKLSSMQQIIR